MQRGAHVVDRAVAVAADLVGEVVGRAAGLVRSLVHRAFPDAIGLPANLAKSPEGKVRKIVVQRYDGEGKLLGQSVSDIPEVNVVNGNCGPGSQTTITRTDGGKQVTTICSDRIRIITRQAAARAHDGARLAALGAAAAARGEAAAARGEAQAAQGRIYARQGMQTALASLRSTRASIAANKDMPEAGRRSALAGIDESIRELQAELDSED